MNIRLIVPCNWQSPSVPSGEQTKYSRTFPDNVEYWGRTIAGITGGFTATQGTGGWIDGHGQLIVEPVTVFDCYDPAETVPELVRAHADDWRLLAAQIARELNQDCVYLEIDGKVEFITK